MTGRPQTTTDRWKGKGFIVLTHDLRTAVRITSRFMVNVRIHNSRYNLAAGTVERAT